MKYYTFGFKTFIFLLMVMQPAVDTQLGKYLLEMMFVIVLFTGLRAIEIKKSLLGFEVLLLLVSLVLNVMGAVTGNEVLFFIGIACRVIFMVASKNGCPPRRFSM